MSLDAIHHHILEQRIQRDAQRAIPHHILTDVERFPHGSHDDRRQSLTGRGFEPRLDARRRLGRAITRLGQAIQGDRLEIDRLLTPARNTNPTQGR